MNETPADAATAPAPVMRCKLRVHQVTRNMNDKGEVDSETVALAAVYSSDGNTENAQWSKWTPSASFNVTINNPAAIGKLSKGHEYYVDFTPVVPKPVVEDAAAAPKPA